MEELFKKKLKGIKHENNRVAIDNFSTISSLLKDNSIISSPKKIKSNNFKHKEFLNDLTNYEYVDGQNINQLETDEKNDEDENEDLILNKKYRNKIKNDIFTLNPINKSEEENNEEKNEENEKKEEIKNEKIKKKIQFEVKNNI